MELRHLEAFTVVADELNFRRAAARLRVSQSPLSQQIKRLEREVGATLLYRTTRHVKLTAAGQAFLAEAQRALTAARAAPRVARQAAAGQIGTVRVGFTGPGSYQALLITARTFRQHRPHVRFDTVRPVLSGELVELLHRDELDAALIRTPIATSGLRVRVITHDAMAAALPSGHRWAERASIDLTEFVDQPIIGYPSGRGSAIAGVIDSSFINQGINPHIVQEAPDTHTIMLLVGTGAGIGFVPATAGHLKVPGVVLVPVRGIPPLGLAIAWRPDGRNPALRALVDLLDDIATECDAH
ncbi:MAG: LysR family transcriptional regulator [Sciscionella sp.]